MPGGPGETGRGQRREHSLCAPAPGPSRTRVSRPASRTCQWTDGGKERAGHGEPRENTKHGPTSEAATCVEQVGLFNHQMAPDLPSLTAEVTGVTALLVLCQSPARLDSRDGDRDPPEGGVETPSRRMRGWRRLRHRLSKTTLASQSAEAVRVRCWERLASLGEGGRVLLLAVGHYYYFLFLSLLNLFFVFLKRLFFLY